MAWQLTKVGDHWVTLRWGNCECIYQLTEAGGALQFGWGSNVYVNSVVLERRYLIDLLAITYMVDKFYEANHTLVGLDRFIAGIEQESNR